MFKMKKIITTSYFILNVIYFLSAQNATKLNKVTLYHPNGKLKVLAFEKNGMKHGISKTYYENGQQKTEKNWQNDIENGKTTFWYKNGFKNYEGQIDNGLESGEWKYYDDIDGKYIYSVFYNKGKIIDYKYIEDQYRWRIKNLKSINILAEFPNTIDSLISPGIMSGYWAMFPYKNKTDLEYYLVGEMPMALSNDEFNKSMNSVQTGESDILLQLFKNSVNDTTTPNIFHDKYSWDSFEKVKINNIEGYKMIITYTDYELKFESFFSLINNKFLLFSIYYPKSTGTANRERFFNSIKYTFE